ncbi:hypothetical protein A6R68_13014 [Neotoma lepida]|uniref:Uncharacterized protein n=1 Tax=Neotoma lepida TaxID=56216 RepID=A0A1A6H1F2_NEOLE|nr:hypothetical protein A6R68_13014 [Neotoma lepida]
MDAVSPRCRRQLRAGLAGLRSRVPGGRDPRWPPPLGRTSRFLVTGSPRRKGRDEPRLFLCRPPGSTCAACGFLGTRRPRPGLALPAACFGAGPELVWDDEPGQRGI